jgi:putative membrane protein
VKRVALSDADHDLVSDAVAQAERHTDGEIVTMVADRSDSYHDVGLHWAVGVTFLALAVYASFPGFYHDLLLSIVGGWEHELSPRFLLTALLFALILKFLFTRYLLAIWPLRMALTPGRTKTRRVHRRAILLFRAGAESRTRARTAVLIYLSLSEHRAEILADKSIASKVSPDVWGDAMAALVEHVRDGRTGAGMAQAVQQVGAILAEHFPRSEDDTNELPDRLIEL